ncbi:hypothetical protein HY213_04915 [Candidatus Peregrinibacteria bacterium]|nr:hypothetical protein [Candidatus Peregrinibacteria bacterium]
MTSNEELLTTSSESDPYRILGLAQVDGKRNVDPLVRYNASRDYRHVLGDDWWPEETQDHMRARSSDFRAGDSSLDPKEPVLGVRGALCHESDPFGDFEDGK